MAQGVYVLSDTHEHGRQRQDSRERVRPAQAGRSVSSRLDRYTLLRKLHKEEPARRVLNIQHWEKAGYTECRIGVAKPEKKRSVVEKTPSTAEQAKNKERSMRRARRHIRGDVLSLCGDHMAVLTYRENMQDRAQALQHLNWFLERMTYRHKEFACITVIEHQKRGAIHFHIVYNGFYRAEEMRTIWYGIVGEKQGNVDVTFYPKCRGNRYTKLAGYISKYIGKELDEMREPGQHRYFRHNIPVHTKEKYYLPDDAPRLIDGVRYETRLFIDILETYYPPETGGAAIWSRQTDEGGWYAAIEAATTAHSYGGFVEM